MSELNLKAEQHIESVEEFKFEPIKGYPMLHWKGKRPFRSTQYFPAQLKETIGEETDGWINKIFWGDNLQVMSHLLKKYRGQVDLIYIDPPFDSKADYKKTIDVRGKKTQNDNNSFEEKQYTDIWTNDEYLQFMYERLILLRELLSNTGSIYLHCDWHKSHLLRCLMDEVFGAKNFKNEIVWCYTGPSQSSNNFPRKHDSIFFYTKTSESYFDSPRVEHKSGVHNTGKMFGGTEENLELKMELESKGKKVEDWWIDIWSTDRYRSEMIGYPTQKPEALLERIIQASSKEGDLIFDCFMGSGTTQAVAMKLGRRFIGADINLGAIDTASKRFIKIQKEIESHEAQLAFSEVQKKYSGFEIYNVNNYDIFRNPVEAKELLIKALELQPLNNNELYDGEKDGRFYKIMPVNRIATKADLNELLTNFPYEVFEKRNEASLGKPVEYITLVCMGHEPDLRGELILQMKKAGYVIDVEVLDILRDKSNLEFKRDATADVVIEGNKLLIRDFYPMNLLQKLSLQQECVDDWKVLVDSVKIDFNYDGAVFTPAVLDVPDKNSLVAGVYAIPATHGSIRVKITDLLSESYEVTI